MSAQISTLISRDDVQSLSRSKQEPQWLADLRADAASATESLEWPKPEKTRIDRWDLTALGSFKPASEAALSEVAQSYIPSEQPNLIVQRNSAVISRKLAEEWQAKGVIFTDLETAAKEHGELVQPYLFNAIDRNEHKLASLHAAIWSGGVFIYVPKNVVLEEPLQAVFLTDDAEATFAPHVIIVTAENSSVTYVEQVVSALPSDAAASVHQGMAEIYVGAGSKVRYASIHEMQPSVVDLVIRKAVIGQDGRMEWVVGDLHEGNILSDTISVLKGNGSNSDAKVITIGKNAQKMSVTTRAIHFGRNSESDMVTRAVMKDQATAIINGITKIEKGATKSNGVQAEKVLMLSPKARGDANPILLIDEDDVKAGHAASVGQVNQEQVYYLMSRGLPRAQAEQLIIRGFLDPVVSEIAIDAVRDQLGALLERKLRS